MRLRPATEKTLLEQARCPPGLSSCPVGHEPLVDTIADMDWAEVLEKRLKDLREWKLGLEHPELPVWPEDPLCTALWIWRSDPDEQRRAIVARRLRYRIECLENEEERESLLVAFRLHPDADYQRQEDLKSRREILEQKRHYGGYRTIQRREDGGIRQIAADLARGMGDPIPFFGRNSARFLIVGGRPMGVWRAWLAAALVFLLVFGIGFWVGAAWFARNAEGYHGFF